jgi:5-methylcytosine-specific restriction endonuclease McrA
VTLRTACRVTGLDIRLIPSTSKVGSAVTYAAFDGEVEVIRRTESGHAATLSAVVETLYRRTCQRVFERAGWKCERCHGIRPLHAHHRQYRSHGRVDSMDNLEALCNPCHQAEHRSNVGAR